MTDSLLNILKYALLALLYLFFARVLWAVWSEVRGPRQNPIQARSAPGDGTHPMPIPGRAGRGGKPGRSSRAQPVPKGRRGEVARLIVLEPKASRGTALGVTNEITFGRAAGCTVSVPDDTYVSQVHARVFSDRGNITVEDLGSTNGTYVNGNRLSTTHVLQLGDRIQIGGTVLEAN
ncbi:MAG: FHA domain-containing protein [Ilumatobacteraceae bacterium]